VIGIVRLARTGSIGEAFNFSAILATIRKIGWVPYILALIVFVVCGIIFEIIAWILMMIPFLGIILVLCLIPPWTIFIARYFSQLYDSAGA
jgi:predicted membrane protein